MAGSPVVVLDVGASKVLCLVGEVQNNSQVKILGLGQSPCTGLRRSAVIDMPQVAESIHVALTEAERSTGLKIAGAYLGMAGTGISTQTNYSTVGISGSTNPISEEDRDRALLAVAQAQVAEDQMVMHRFVQSYAVDGEPVLAAHGDAYCTADAEYQSARAMLRSAAWQAGALAMPLEERRVLAASLRAKSIEAGENKADNIMDVTPAAIDAALTEAGAALLVHGHTHRPGIHDLGAGRRRIVLGDWHRCGWKLLLDRGDAALICFGLRN